MCSLGSACSCHCIVYRREAEAEDREPPSALFLLTFFFFPRNTRRFAKGYKRALLRMHRSISTLCICGIFLLVLACTVCAKPKPVYPPLAAACLTRAKKRSARASVRHCRLQVSGATRHDHAAFSTAAHSSIKSPSAELLHTMIHFSHRPSFAQNLT